MATATEVMPIDAPVDPDAQATVTDFLDYTEYLPSDLIRSLTLIGKLDESYLSLTNKIHQQTATYGILPTINPTERPKPQLLRHQISTTLDYALGAREAAYAEASRLYDEVDRHYNRLTSVTAKLHALPKPPSRDPSPVARPHSPHASRIRTGKKDENGTAPPPRITLRLDNARTMAQGARVPGVSHRPRHQRHKVTVPGEVLPPPNPDSPPPITDSDWESSPPSPIPMPTSRVGAPSRHRTFKPGRTNAPKPPKAPKIKTQKPPRPPRPPRPPGAMGTNVHSAVAGISTSNALSLLTPPPPDAKPGSVHAPWMRLTEWEMARLRKRMKKNAIWTPSETMIRRELSDAGRGPENYYNTKEKADELGVEFLDCDNIATKAPGKPLVPGEISADSLGMSEKLSNKGMKLNEAKKLKKELLAREQAVLAAAEAAEAARAQGDIGNRSKSLNGKAYEMNGTLGPVDGRDKSKEKPLNKTPRKRKRDATPAVEDAQLQSEIVLSPMKPSPKKRKIVPLITNVSTTVTTVPLAAAAPSSVKATTPAPQPISPTTTRKPTIASSRSRRPSVTMKASVTSPEPSHSSSQPVSRPASRRASAGPLPDSATREHLRRKSATPAPAPMATAASRRSKRPAPGPVTSSQDGGAAVSVGRRKNAPRKRGTAAAANAAKKIAEGSVKDREEEMKADEDAAGEDIDPDEPRYCLCGDVSFGTMICCESIDCEREWFHLECVGLQEPPGRRAKWYCPDCKAKLGKK